MGVNVVFFGVLAEVTGTTFKSYSGIRTLFELRLKLEDDFPEIIHYNYRFFHNSLITTGNQLLNDGDEIALLPPFAGG